MWSTTPESGEVGITASVGFQDGQTPLHMAASGRLDGDLEGRLACIALLLSCKANLELPDKVPCPALPYTALLYPESALPWPLDKVTPMYRAPLPACHHVIQVVVTAHCPACLIAMQITCLIVHCICIFPCMQGPIPEQQACA